jgi:hypothetical protein
MPPALKYEIEGVDVQVPRYDQIAFPDVVQNCGFLHFCHCVEDMNQTMSVSRSIMETGWLKLVKKEFRLFTHGYDRRSITEKRAVLFDAILRVRRRANVLGYCGTMDLQLIVIIDDWREGRKILGR